MTVPMWLDRGQHGGARDRRPHPDHDLNRPPRAYADYPGAEVLESGAAVAIVPVLRATGPRTGPRQAYAQKREVTVVLSRRLGHRVLRDSTGSPVMVNV